MNISSPGTSVRPSQGLLRPRSRWVIGFTLMIALGCGTFAHGAVPPSPLELPSDPQRLCSELDVVDGELLFEGDIKLGFCTRDDEERWSFEPRGVFAKLATGWLPPDPSKAAVRLDDRYWPDAVMPYVISEDLSQANNPLVFGRIQDAIRHWRELSSVRLIPRTDEAAYVEFVAGGGCSSFVGRIGGRQTITLSSTGGCSYGSTVHEIGHALGYWHEQSRQDRDDFITVHSERIEEGREHNFNKYSSGLDLNAYDYGSIMHYSAGAFAVGADPTIEVLPGPYAAWAAVYGDQGIGQRRRLSVLDRLAAEEMYDVCWPGTVLESGWKANPWSRCSASCDDPGRARFVYCLDASGACADDALCDGATRPTAAESCTDLLSCDFDVDSCGWDSADPDDVFDLSPGFLGTPSSGTGPGADHTGGGHYLYMEASSPRQAGDVAYLTSVPTDFAPGTQVSFWYHALGDALGSLELQEAPCGGASRTLWSMSPVSEDLWKEARVTLTGATATRLRFVFTRGSGFRGDIAVDDVTVTQAADGLFFDGFESGGTDRWSSATR